MLYGESFSESPMVSQVDGAAVTAAAATSLLPAASKFNIPANWAKIGRKIKVEAWGRLSCVITTPGTARFDLRVTGGSVIFDSLAVLLDPVVHTNVPWYLKIDLTCRAIGSAANFFGGGMFSCEAIKGNGTMPIGNLVAMLPWNTAPAVGGNADFTVNNVLDLFFTQTVATGSCQCHQFEVNLPN